MTLYSDVVGDLISKGVHTAEIIMNDHPDKKEREAHLNFLRDQFAGQLERQAQNDPRGIDDRNIEQMKIFEIAESHIRNTLEPEQKGGNPEAFARQRLKALAQGVKPVLYMNERQLDTSNLSTAGCFQTIKKEAHTPQAPTQSGPSLQMKMGTRF